MSSDLLPALVRTCYLRENKLETLPGGGESVLCTASPTGAR